MNREAAALGVPVYSIFRGKTGSVDRYLSDNDRLVLLLNSQDLKRIKCVKRNYLIYRTNKDYTALDTIVETVTSFFNSSLNEL